MIASVRGTVTSLAAGSVVLEVGGVGLAVQCTPATLGSLRVGQSAQLSTSLVVREDSLTLYGFTGTAEREVFEVLQTATGVGPRLAQAVLSVHSADAVRAAVAAEDLAALTLVPGIGRKGAQRIVLELKDRLGPGVPEAARGGGSGVLGAARSGLLELGYTVREADAALAAVAATGGEADADVASVLRAALSVLRRAR